MADVQDSFTQRILRRASLRRHHNSKADLNSSEEVLQRRYNILRAINEPSSRRGSCIGINDSQQFDQTYDFSRDSFNNNNSTASNKNIYTDDKKSDPKCTKFFELGNINRSEVLNNEVNMKISNLAQKEVNSFFNSLMDEDSLKDKSTNMLKLMEDNVDSSSKIEAGAKPSENNSNVTFDVRFTEATEPMRTSAIAAFDDSDAETEPQNTRTKNTFTTEAVIEMCNRVQTALELNCESSDLKYVETKKVPSSGNPKNTNEDSIISAHSVENEIEAPTLLSPMKLTHSDLRKKLFPTTSQVVSTTATIAVPTALDRKSESSDEWEEIEYLDEITPYDENKFLADALGDELYRTSVTYDDSCARDRTGSNFTASDLMSEDAGFPLRREAMQILNLPTSVPPSFKSVSTLNRSMRIYRSLSQRIKKKFRPSVKSKDEVPAVPKVDSGSEEIYMIQDLLQEVKAQQTLMNEAAKALHLSDSKKDLLSDSERVESERLLLLASLRRKAALEEIKAITSDEGCKESLSFREKAEITISDISFDLRNSLRVEQQCSETAEWFVVAVTQGLNVWVSSVICRTNESRLTLPESISIPNLTPGFKIVVQVYSLRVGRQNYNEDKSRIAKQPRSTLCLPYSSILASPTKLFKKIEKLESPKIHDQINAWRSRNSAFVLSGFTQLFLQDLSSSSSWSLMLVPANSTLNGTIDLNLACRLHLSTTHEGFLNFYEEIGGYATWNRRWCVLKGHTMMFWNYPREQDVKEPLKIIELMACVSNEITSVDRTICPKPRTLLIETERSRNAEDRDSMIVECTSTSTFVRNLLSYDSTEELNEWSKKLNHVLLALEEWHIIGQRTQPQVSDL